jgi:hypothetical protein
MRLGRPHDSRHVRGLGDVILGEEGYKRFLQVNAEAVEETQSTLFRFSPNLSKPPEEIARVAADFWHPKPMMATAASKPRTATGKTAELKPPG